MLGIPPTDGHPARIDPNARGDVATAPALQPQGIVGHPEAPVGAIAERPAAPPLLERHEKKNSQTIKHGIPIMAASHTAITT
jgi:hypothetical protein